MTIGFVVLSTVSASALIIALVSLWQMTKTSAKRVAAAPSTAVGIATAKEVTSRTRESAIASTAAAGSGARQLAATVQNRSRPVARRGGRAAKVIAARSAESIDNLLDRAERRGQPALAPPALPAPTGPAKTPAGWYPCPYDVSRIRWFDGTEWSEHSRPAQ